MALEPGDPSFVSKLDEAGKKRAKEELNELNEIDREIAVQTFRQWILDQDWLKTPTDFGFLLRFLRVRKFSQLGARETLENYWKNKEKSPEWFRNLDPQDVKIQSVLRSGCILCPKNLDKHGRRILLIRASVLNPEVVKNDWGVDSFYRAGMLVLEWLSVDEYVQVNGLVIIFDHTDTSLPLILTLADAEKSRKCHGFLQKALPSRLKAMYMYNEPTFIDMFMSIILPFFRDKIKDRIAFHGQSLVRIFDDVGMAVLPGEYLPDEYTGPSSGTIKKITDEMIEDLMKPEFRDYILELSSGKYGVDLEKRKCDEEPAASYRKLNVS